MKRNRKAEAVKQQRQPGKPTATVDRLTILAQEITLAGGQVLRERFGFTGEQVNEWVRLMIEQGKKNRQRTPAVEVKNK